MRDIFIMSIIDLATDGLNTIIDEVSSTYDIDNPFGEDSLEVGAPNKFPANLDDAEFGGLKIEFQAWENKGLQILEKTGSAISSTTSTYSQAGIFDKVKAAVQNPTYSQIDDLTSTLKSAVNDLTSKIGNVFKGTATSVSDTAKEIWKRDNNTQSNSIATTTVNMTLKDTWQVFIPPTISASYSASWAKTELSFLGNVLKSAMSSLPQQATNAATLLNREVVNPQSELLFQGIDHRTFSYNFNLFPKNTNETTLIKNLVLFFKSNMSSEIANNTATMVLRYPNYFRIRYLKKGTDNPFLNKIAYCVLESCDVTYKDGATGFHKDGSPSSVNLTLRFREIEPIYRQMINEGY